MSDLVRNPEERFLAKRLVYKRLRINVKFDTEKIIAIL